ncbi:UNVERIFIED_CONTAM: hypothetical protein FKN15_074281 [Acipenser sinensis]
MARGSPPEFASRGSAAAAVASRGSAAAAVASRGSAAAAVAWGRKGSCFAWGHPGSCFAWNWYSFCRTAGSTGADASEKGAVGYKEGWEVRRPAPPAALSRQDIRWSEPHKGELLAMKKGGRSGDQLPQPHFRGRRTSG